MIIKDIAPRQRSPSAAQITTGDQLCADSRLFFGLSVAELHHGGMRINSLISALFISSANLRLIGWFGQQAGRATTGRAFAKMIA